MTFEGFVMAELARRDKSLAFWKGAFDAYVEAATKAGCVFSIHRDGIVCEYNPKLAEVLTSIELEDMQ